MGQNTLVQWCLYCYIVVFRFSQANTLTLQDIQMFPDDMDIYVTSTTEGIYEPIPDSLPPLPPLPPIPLDEKSTLQLPLNLDPSNMYEMSVHGTWQVSIICNG